jgi:hypothetical protein
MGQPPGGGPPPGGPRAPDWGEMKGKLAAAKGPERLILIGGLLFFIDSFLPWYGVGGSVGGFRFGFNIKGWSAGGLSVIAILLGLAATLLVLASTVGMQLPVQTTGQLLLGLCGGAFLFVLLRFITQTSASKYGLYLAIVFTGIMTFGAWQRYKAAS